MYSQIFIMLVASIISAEAVNTQSAFEYGVCTVVNRIENGWSPERVMEHYYASPLEPTGEELETTKRILNDENYDCKDYYFMYSDDDFHYLFEEAGGYWVCETENKCNVFMTKEDFKDAKRKK